MRIRTIKPEFWANEHIASLDDFTQLLAIGLLNYADDEGYFNANPELIRSAIFPLRDCSRKCTVAITSLEKIGYIKLYTAKDGRKYGHVVKFLSHQVINKPKDSKIRELCESGTSTVAIPDADGTSTGGNGREQGTGNGSGKPLGVGLDKSGTQLKAEALFNKRPTTPWDDKERKAYANNRATIEATNDEEWALLARFHAAPSTDKNPVYRRRDLATLLNNWSAEITRARDWASKQSEFAGAF